MIIQRINTGMLESNMYIVKESGHAIVIDTCSNTTVYESAEIYDWIVLTHEHYDYISRINIWRGGTDTDVWFRE